MDALDLDAWELKGKILYNLGNYDAAIECADKAIQLDTGRDSMRLANSWFLRGTSLHNKGREEEARRNAMTKP
jgi:tetratricopeptide (TPR) repeat protein